MKEVAPVEEEKKAEPVAEPVQPAAEPEAKPVEPVSTAIAGTLELHVIEAKFTRDTDTWGSMDPWMAIECGEQKMRTKEMEGAGKTPKWDDVFMITIKDLENDKITF